MTQQRRPGSSRAAGRAAGRRRLRRKRARLACRSARRRRPLAPQGLGLDSAAVRARMVQRLAASGIQSQAVLAALGAVERHRFVDSALVNQAYEDTSLPIGLAQTISKPSVVARMVELLMRAESARGGSLGRVLEIGTGCGYQAAVLARWPARCTPSSACARCMRRRATTCARCAANDVHLLLGDGMVGYAKGAPYAPPSSSAAGARLRAAAVVRPHWPGRPSGGAYRRGERAAGAAGHRQDSAWSSAERSGGRQFCPPKIGDCLKGLLMCVSRGLVAWVPALLAGVLLAGCGTSVNRAPVETAARPPAWSFRPAPPPLRGSSPCPVQKTPAASPATTPSSR